MSLHTEEQKTPGNSENLEWEEISTEHIVQDEWIDFRRSAYRFPDGSVFEPFYSYSRRDYVVIVATDEDGKYLCVRQFRQGIGEVTTEFPAGGIERSDGKEYWDGEKTDVKELQADRGAEAGEGSQEAAEGAAADGSVPGAVGKMAAREDALEAAKRELLEETGYVSDEWRHLLTVPSNATIADNYAYIFQAEHCRKSGGQHLDETEFLHVRKHSAAELEQLIAQGGFQQAVHIMAWLLSRQTRTDF